jgi:hypothetical protein
VAAYGQGRPYSHSLFSGISHYKSARWTGLNKKSSIWTGIVCSTIFQGTVEVFDGYSAKWGFSLSDMTANMAGTSIFALQQYYWNEQKIIIKVSSFPKTYSNVSVISSDGLATTDLNTRANDLFGSGFLKNTLKITMRRLTGLLSIFMLC